MERPKYPTIGNPTINTKEAEKLLHKLKINKASVPDDIPAYILRETATDLARIFTALVSQSLNKGTLPDER